jgi:hypothetical protein
VSLELRPDADAGLGRQAGELDQRRVADGLDQVLEAPAAGAIQQWLVKHGHEYYFRK